MNRSITAVVALTACGFALFMTACSSGLFKQKDYLNRTVTQQETREIGVRDLVSESRTDPISVEQATTSAVQEIIRPPAPLAKVDLSLADVRAAALQGNLDLKVEVINPQIVALNIDVEEARFESAFTALARRSDNDSPTIVGTEGSRSTINEYNLGVNIPLRTGGTVNVNLPLSDIETNNPFSTINPAYTSDLRFSISQNLLRDAGVNTNTHFIRVARFDEQATEARTKLEAMRILADADRRYWTLYAARRELEVRQKQYELAVTQLEQAKRRVNAGDVAQIEVTRAESGVAESLRAIIISQTAIRRFQRDLKRIMQRPDLPMAGPTEIMTTTEPAPVGLDLDAEALTAFAVVNRMEMLELELQLAADASAVDFRRNQKLPRVLLDYNYSVNGLGSSYDRSFSQLGENRFNDWSIGLSAEIPIGNESAKALYKQAVLTRLQRLATKEQRRTAIQQEVYDALDVLQQNWQRILAARQASVFAGRTYDAEKRQFDVGVRTSTDVLDAAARLADAQSQEVIALADYQISLIDIAFATGTLLGHQRVRWDTDEQLLKQVE